MTTQTKQELLTIIKAWVEGKIIQVRRSDGSTMWTDFVGDAPEIFATCWNWRIKPEPITVWLNIYDIPDSVPGSVVQHWTRKSADAAAGAIDRIACIQITYTEGEGL